MHYVEKINDCLYKPFQVDAAVLKLTPLVKPKIRVEYCVLETVVKALFQYRRKYIRKGARFIVLHIPIYLSILHRLISRLPTQLVMSKYKNRQMKESLTWVLLFLCVKSDET